MQVEAIFSPFDTTRKVPESYLEFLGEGLRETLVIPHPLSVNAYDANAAGLMVEGAKRGEYATATVRSFYRFTLHRDGRLTSVRVVGGVRNPDFDRAVVRALDSLDSSQLLPPPHGFDEAFDNDSLPMRLTITGGTVVSSRFTGTLRSVRSGVVTPLLRLRVPLLRVDHEVAGVPGTRTPRYPESMRANGIEGEVLLEFLVRSDSTVDPESIQAWKVTSIDFLKAVLAVLPDMRFFPMRITGCDVASLVRMPFMFSLNR